MREGRGEVDNIDLLVLTFVYTRFVQIVLTIMFHRFIGKTVPKMDLIRKHLMIEG